MLLAIPTPGAATSLALKPVPVRSTNAVSPEIPSTLVTSRAVPPILSSPTYMIYAWECNKDVWDAKRRAESGNVSAMRDLATWYYYGCRGLPKDNATSYAWCRRAADLGCTISMTTMCKCFLLNSDMADLYSPTLGVYYLTQAADNGYAGACVMLGTAFMKGQHGLPKDDALAERWLKSAMVKHDATNGLKIMARLLLEKLQVSS
mmetsp:Transcript_13516/g.28737  ORF Transcript_13516/g.28737 Transcript_13516/m.28737 type:complete len:205 (+) Transcript_13516:135-749(+)